jgi:hypothetical protein
MSFAKWEYKNGNEKPNILYSMYQSWKSRETVISGNLMEGTLYTV